MSADAPPISFFIPGLPRSTQTGSVVQAGGRAIPLRRGSSWSGYCGLVALQHKPPIPWAGPLIVKIECFFPRPKRVTRPFPMLVDLGNLCKGPLDAFQGILYLNDKQIVTQEITERWADQRGPGMAVTILEAGP